jgi:hypothetical protein
MPAPQNNQGFVQPSSGGTGNWLGKLFGGIGDKYRAQNMAQLQLNLHTLKGDVDTENFKTRTAYSTGSKDWLDEQVFERGGRAIDRGIEKGPDLNKNNIAGFDRNYMPQMQRTGQRVKENKAADTTDATINTPPNDNTPPNNTPPVDRGGNPTRKAKARNATLKDTMAALSAGKIDKEQAADMSPTYARNLGKKTASESITNPESNATPAKVRKPRTPKAGA